MKHSVLVFIQIALLPFYLTAQDYTLIYERNSMGGSTWTGTYVQNNSREDLFEFNQLAILDSFFGGATTVSGSGGCGPLNVPVSAPNSNGGFATLPVGQSVEIFNNHPTTTVLIGYFIFDCFLNVIEPDTTLLPGESITIFRGREDCIAPVDSGLCLPDPVPTLGQWAIINLFLLMNILGAVSIRQRRQKTLNKKIIG